MRCIAQYICIGHIQKFFAVWLNHTLTHDSLISSYVSDDGLIIIDWMTLHFGNYARQHSLGYLFAFGLEPSVWPMSNWRPSVRLSSRSRIIMVILSRSSLAISVDICSRVMLRNHSESDWYCSFWFWELTHDSLVNGIAYGCMEFLGSSVGHLFFLNFLAFNKICLC